MKLIIVGGGKVGYYLVKTLIDHGHEPVLIEQDKKVCTMIANTLDIPIILGDGTSIDILEKAKTHEAQAIVGVTGKDENNLICCQLAKKLFGVPRTIAKVNNPKNAMVLKQLGVDIPLSSTDNIARMLEYEIDSSNIKKLISVNSGEATISEILLPYNFKLADKELHEIKLPVSSIIISIHRNGKTIIPRGHTRLLPGDKVLVMTLSNDIYEINKILKLD